MDRLFKEPTVWPSWSITYLVNEWGQNKLKRMLPACLTSESNGQLQHQRASGNRIPRFSELLLYFLMKGLREETQQEVSISSGGTHVK